MPVLLIFPVLVAGFFACHIHPIHAYKLHRYEGQYLYLKSAELGIKCFAIGAALAFGAHAWLPDRIQLCNVDLSLQLAKGLAALLETAGAKDHTGATKGAWFFILAAATFIGAFVAKAWGYGMLYLRFGSKDRQKIQVYVMGRILADSPLDNLLFELSLSTDKYAMISLEDRKVYVGKVIDMGEPTETNGIDQDISIMPLMSGYRDKDTLKVEFTTDYDEVEADIYLSLRQDTITSVTEFDFDAYQKLTEGRNEKRQAKCWQKWKCVSWK